MSDADMADFFRAPTARYHTKSYPFISPNRPELSTKGKSALVTGAALGTIGGAIALSLAKSGISTLGLLGRTESRLQQTQEEISKISPGTEVHVYTVDILDLQAVTSALESFAGTTATKRIDILAANAGYLPFLKSIADTDPADWWQAFEINIRGNFNLLRAWVPHRPEKDGVVVHTGSSAIYIPYIPGFSAYRGSKAGATKVFEFFADEMADKFGPEAVRVVQYHPGLIRTTMSDKFGDSLEGVPFDDIDLSGDFFNWLVSDEARFLSGKFIAANWDAEEMVQKQEEIAGNKHLYTINLVGWQ